ncbi:hypothetical protein [Flexivirga endophytica]|uniref:hypothetical protein n=1 Tax=Flexivirga endophytica TaxID=1849103 RepID=UPI001669E11B|nr:hypothetical protein [Flexivirga endophytica]
MTARAGARSLASKYGRAVAAPVLVNAGSQLSGLIQYVLLIVWTGAGHTTDYFFLLLAWTSVPMQLVLTGVCYPLLLRGAKEAACNWMKFSILLVPLSSAPAVAIYTSRLGDVQDAFLLTVLTVLFSGLVLVATYDGFREAVRGDAFPLSAATFFGSLGAIFGLCAFKVTHAGAGTVTMLVGAIFGEITFLVMRAFQRSARLGAHARGGPNARVNSATAVDSVAETNRQASGWYLGKSIAGYGGGLTLQSYAASLAPAFLSYFSVAQRVVGGCAGVFSNSVLPFLVHGETQHSREAGRVTLAVSAAASFAGIGIAAFIGVVQSERDAGLVLLLTAWMSTSLYAAGMQRLAYRLLPAKVSAAPIVTSLVVVLMISFLLSINQFSPAVLLVGMVLLDGVSSIIFAVRLSLRNSAASMALGALSLSVIGVSLMGHGSF